MPLFSLRFKLATRIAAVLMILWLLLLAMHAPLHRSERLLSERRPTSSSAIPGGFKSKFFERGKANEKTNDRKEMVLEAIRHSWMAYESNAFGSDEFNPISRRGTNWDKGPGIGVFLIDALDTLHLASMDDAVERCVQWIDKQSFAVDISVSLFETTIRVLGGLMSAFHLTDDERLLRAATRLGDRLVYAFQTPSGIPDNYVNLRTGEHHGAQWVSNMAILSEFGSLQLEFLALSEATGNATYAMLSRRAVEVIRPSCHGLCPRLFAGSNGSPPMAGVGSFGDSFYEYTLKYALATGGTDPMYRSLWQEAAAAIVSQSRNIGGALIPPTGGGDLDHLSCFVGGLFALSYLHGGNRGHLEYADGIANTCHRLHTMSLTGLPPDTVRVGADGKFVVVEGKYILRPEFAETLMYLYRVTRNETYREWGHRLLSSCNKYLRVGAGYVGAKNVDAIPVVPSEFMETFWLAETLKYLLLLFDDNAIDLRMWIFNTEGHPLKFRRYENATVGVVGT